MFTRQFRRARRTIVLAAVALFLAAMPRPGHAQTATITSIGGNGSSVPSIPDGITATSAQIPYPTDVDVDDQGTVYFTYSPDGFGVAGAPDVHAILSSGKLLRIYQFTGIGGLSWADGIAVTPTGDAVYFTNYAAGSSLVYKATTTGSTRIGANYSFNFPFSPTVGIRVRNGLVYVADPSNNKIVRIGSDNTATVIAGTGAAGHGGDGGAATQAKLNNAQAVAVDGSGVVFIADTFNHCVRKISTAGTISTIGGSCLSQGFSGDGGIATSANMSQPSGIAVASSGAVYVSDTGNNRVRRINTDGTIETVAGGGQCNGPFNCILGDGGPGTIATLNNPHGLAFDSQGRLYIADSGYNRIRMLTFGPTPSSTAPKITTDRILNAGSYTPTVSQGAWAAIYGTNLSSKPPRVWAASDFIGDKLPTSLDGTSVTFNGIPAAISYVSATQLNVHVPDGLPVGGVTVAVTTGAGTGTGTVVHQATAPALFTSALFTTATGIVYTYPTAVHLDGTLVGRPNVIPGSRPASGGEIIIIFGTGFGPSNPARPSGYIIQPSLLDSLITVTLPTGRFLPLASALISPGLYQFNVTVPTGLQSNTDYAIQIGFLGGGQSQGGVHLPVN